MENIKRYGPVRTLIIFYFLFLFNKCQAYQKYDLFYICIGSSYYISHVISNAADSITVFDDVKGAGKSARLVANQLQDKGAAGILLKPDEEGNYIDKKAFFSQIDSIKPLLQKSRHPFLIYYYCGHGISEAMSGMRYFIPGTFVGKLAAMHAEEKRLQTVLINDVYDTLSGLRVNSKPVPFLLMADCCADKEYEYYEVFSELFSGTAINSLDGIIDVLKAWYDLQGSSPALFSARLGQSVLTVKDPTDEGSVINIGPLCRRFLLATAQVGKRGVSLEKLVTAITGNKLDSLTDLPDAKCIDSIDQQKRYLY